MIGRKGMRNSGKSEKGGKEKDIYQRGPGRLAISSCSCPCPAGRAAWTFPPSWRYVDDHGARWEVSVVVVAVDVVAVVVGGGVVVEVAGPAALEAAFAGGVDAGDIEADD